MSNRETQSVVCQGADPIIDVLDLQVCFGRQHVLRDIDVSIARGQTIAIIGESGCGKTVLLKSMIGLVRPTGGAVYFDGSDLCGISDKQLTQQRTRFGLVFQNAALFDSMTVGQNVAFPLKQHTKLSKQEIDQIVHERLAEVGLSSWVVTKKPAELSGGMRKRVGLARALVMDPEVLLYDEPTTGLDPIVSDVINELIRSTCERKGVSSVVITHDMKTARKVADRIVMLYPLSRLSEDEPQIVFDGTPGDLDSCADERVRQFVQGEASGRLMELRADRTDSKRPTVPLAGFPSRRAA